MSKSKNRPRKGTYQYIRSGLTVKRFTNFLKRAGKNEVGMALDSDNCPIARFVVDALGAQDADISGGSLQARVARKDDGYDAGTLVGLPSRKWAGRFIEIVDDIFGNSAVTGSQALRVLRLALDPRVDPGDLQDWQTAYVRAGRGSVRAARRKASHG